jgi:hypothetical protein
MLPEIHTRPKFRLLAVLESRQATDEVLRVAFAFACRRRPHDHDNLLYHVNGLNRR